MKYAEDILVHWLYHMDLCDCDMVALHGNTQAQSGLVGSFDLASSVTFLNFPNILKLKESFRFKIVFAKVGRSGSVRPTSFHVVIVGKN